MKQLNRQHFLGATASLCLGMKTNLLLAANDGGIYKPQEKRVVNIHMGGGQTHLDFWDPKPENQEVMGATKAIETNTGIQVGHWLPKLSQHFDKMALIRGMNNPEGSHGRGTYLADTGYRVIGTIKHPSLGPKVSKFMDRIHPELPTSVVVGSGTLDGSAGYLGSMYDSFKVVSASEGLGALVPEGSGGEAYARRLKMMIALGEDFRKDHPQNEVKAMSSFYNEAIKMLRSKDLEAFDLSKESAAKRSFYGNNEFGDRLLLTKRLLKAGVRSIQVNSPTQWDQHIDIFQKLPETGKMLDTGLAAFMSDLYEEGLLENTIVTYTTEFGRTPDIHGQRKGRDHYPKAYSNWIAGAGIKGGAVLGKTDERGAKVVEDKVTPFDVHQTLRELLGISKDKEIYSSDNRPFPFEREGKVLSKILS